MNIQFKDKLRYIRNNVFDKKNTLILKIIHLKIYTIYAMYDVTLYWK